MTTQLENQDEYLWLRALFAELRGLHATRLTFPYSGGGDDGSIHPPEVTYSVEQPDPVRATMRVHQMFSHTDDIGSRAMDMLYEALNDVVGDWVNNDGGSGQVYLDPLKEEITCEGVQYETIGNPCGGTLLASLKDASEQEEV